MHIARAVFLPNFTQFVKSSLIMDLKNHEYSCQPMHLLLSSHPTCFGVHYDAIVRGLYTIIITEYPYDSWWS
jgi:hypothetical protein